MPEDEITYHFKIDSDSWILYMQQDSNKIHLYPKPNEVC